MNNYEKKLASAIWIYGLHSKASINYKVLSEIINECGNIEELLDYNTKTILEMIKVPPEKVNKAKYYLKDKKNKENALKSAAINSRLGVNVIGINESLYPEQLKEISSPPAFLFYKGVKAIDILNENLFVSIVGTRNPTSYGKAVTRKYVSELVERGAVIISGMARGIDSIAHEVCLENEGNTIAVLGCGLDIVYPPENKLLMNEIMNKGLLLSEYPPGTAPRRDYFPARNRIISGLCDCLAIMEAAKKSGTMITAGFAGDQGKDLFAVPGSVFSPESQGTNQLIQDGACVLTNVDDMLWKYPFKIKKSAITINDKSEKIENSKNSDEINLENTLLFCEKTIDEISEELNISIEKTVELVTLKELEGVIIIKNGRITLTDSYK